MMFTRYLQTVCETTFSGDDELSPSSSQQGSFDVNQLPYVEQTSPCNSLDNFLVQHQQQPYHPANNNAKGENLMEEFFPGMTKYGSENSKSSLLGIENILKLSDSSTLNSAVSMNNTYIPASTQFKSFNPLEGWYNVFKFFF